MIYIYDILLNFTDSFFYDFYEWNNKDNLVNVQKIPCIYVDKKTMYDFINYKIRVNKSFLKRIENKSIYLRKDKGKYLYSAILSSDEKCIGVCFDEKGFIKYKSALLLDEEEDINRIILKQGMTFIKYKKYNNNSYNILRCDIEKRKVLIKELKRVYLNKEFDKLKYIYYEIYNCISNDIEKMYKEILNGINNNISKYNFLLENLKIK